MKLRTDYMQIIEDLVKIHETADKAIKATGITKTTFYEIKRGRTTNPSVSTYIKMIEGLNKNGDIKQ